MLPIHFFPPENSPFVVSGLSVLQRMRYFMHVLRFVLFKETEKYIFF